MSHSPAIALPALPARRSLGRGKRVFDIAFSLALLPVLAVVAAALVIANPFANRGALIYVQWRMGRDCRAFKLYKFRTMRTSERSERAADAPLEAGRITPLGAILRRYRLDELPQLWNVLRGEMSLIGPRPDCLAHARAHLREVPGYRARLCVLPGLSGLAQVEHGYAEGPEALRRKVLADLAYIDVPSLAQEAEIFARTVATVLLGKGR